MLTHSSAVASIARRPASAALIGAGGTAKSPRVVSWRKPRRRCQRPGHGDQRKEHGVRVGDPQDLEAPSLEPLAQQARRIAADLAAEHRMIAPEHVERRHVHQEGSPRLEHAVHLGDGGPLALLGQAIQNIEGRDDIEGIAGERNGGGACLGDSTQTELSGELEAPPGQIEAARAAVVFEAQEVRAGAAAAVEDPGAGEAGGRLFEERLHESCEAPIPEVPLFGRVGRLEQLVHG